MWQTAHGVLIAEVIRPGSANAIFQHYVHWWKVHNQGRGTASFATELPSSGAHLSVEQIWVSRPEMSVRRAHWVRTTETHWGLAGEEIVQPGRKRFAYRPHLDQSRFLFRVQATRLEKDIQEHAWRSHGDGAMALLRPDWLLHGRRVVEEWGDEIDAVWIVRRRTERVVPLESSGMMGHEFNPLVMEEAEQVVFGYDPEHDVIREWHDLWEGKPCTSYRFHDLRFDEGDGIGEPYVIERIEDAS